MEFFFDSVYANPYLTLAGAFAFFAAISFLLFLRGFFSGIIPVFTIEGHEGHMLEHRVRAVWGLMLLLALFTIWEIVRVLGAFLSGAGGPWPGWLVVLGFVWLVYFVLYQLVIKHSK